MGLLVQNVTTTELHANDYVCKINVSGLPTHSNLQQSTREFFGDFALHPSVAIDNAYKEVLRYLTNNKFIKIMDYSYPLYKQAKEDLDGTTACLIISNSNEDEYRMMLNEIARGYKFFLSDLDNVFKKYTTALPISVKEIIVEDESATKLEVEYTGARNSANPLHALTEDLVRLRRNALLFACNP